MIEFRPIAYSEAAEVVVLWQACGLLLPWSDPISEAKQAIERSHSTIIGAFAGAHLIGAAMTRWDGHRGRIYHLGVEADFRRWGIGRNLVRQCEEWLALFNARKVELVVHTENEPAASFCEAIGYKDNASRVFYRHLRSRA